MLIIPAIDIKDGKCVRLKQGDFSDTKVYLESPLETANYFENLGAKRLHIVDLDGAATGTSQNRTVIKQLLAELRIPIQLGGGIRSFEEIGAWLDLGVSGVVVGTLAIEKPEMLLRALVSFGVEPMILALDCRQGKVASQGWQKQSEIEAADLARTFQIYGLERVLYTDIARDGMLTGPNITSLKDLAVKTDLKVTASGGVSSNEDLQQLRALEEFGVDSVVVGKAFYERRILAEDVL